MEQYLVWLIAAFTLVIVELVSGTFYLLVLGIAGFAGAAVASAGLAFWWQALSAAAVALAGCVWVHHWHRRASLVKSTFSVDAGQPAVFESWINRDGGHARVKYRDAQWDANIRDATDPQPGEVFYVVCIHGNTLEVSKTRPG
jgi:membrane protein implicated in regulation of membrane protease activity